MHNSILKDFLSLTRVNDLRKTPHTACGYFYSMIYLNVDECGFFLDEWMKIWREGFDSTRRTGGEIIFFRSNSTSQIKGKKYEKKKKECEERE